MREINIIHIHTDYKFIVNSTLFKGDLFNNELFIIERKIPYSKKLNSNEYLFNDIENDLNRIIERCEVADLVILYDLDVIKCRIALNLSSKIKIAWRFFGHELYGKRKDLFLSSSSKKIDSAIWGASLIYECKKRLATIKQILKFGKSNITLFHEAIIRCDYMIGLSTEEYDFLKTYWANLPEFIELPRRAYINSRNISSLEKEKNEESPIIILGNSRNSFNNHLDIIKLIENEQKSINYEFKILFNYGLDKKYAQEVRDKVKNRKYFNLIDSFLPIEEFKTFYHKPTVLVINSYRQMAGGNILMAFENGMKVYLNKKNIYRTCLLNEGFKVFTIEDFENDLKTNNLNFDKELAVHNIKSLELYSKRRTIRVFQEEVYNKLID